MLGHGGLPKCFVGGQAVREVRVEYRWRPWADKPDFLDPDGREVELECEGHVAVVTSKVNDTDCSNGALCIPLAAPAGAGVLDDVGGVPGGEVCPPEPVREDGDLPEDFGEASPVRGAEDEGQCDSVIKILTRVLEGERTQFDDATDNIEEPPIALTPCEEVDGDLCLPVAEQIFLTILFAICRSVGRAGLVRWRKWRKLRRDDVRCRGLR